MHTGAPSLWGMTALVSLATRLAMARVALLIPGAAPEISRLAPVIEAGVDLLVLGGSDDVDADVEALRDVRRRWGATPLLVGTSSKKVAALASADVVHLRRPGWRFWGYPEGHQWSLLGRNASEIDVVSRPGDAFDYLFVGPLEGPDDSLLGAAVKRQPPLTPGAVPWFALGDFGVDDVAPVLAAGARRIALSGELAGRDDAADVVRGIAEAVTRAWASDDRSSGYRTEAFRH